MNTNDEIKIANTIAVLNDEPTINERLDKLEKMLEQILLRLSLYSIDSTQIIYTNDNFYALYNTTTSNSSAITYNVNQK